MRRPLVLVVIALAACSDSTSPSPFVQTKGTYSEFMIDGQLLPVQTPRDTTCHDVNMGGWLTLTVDGKYAMMLDRTRLVCNGVNSGASAIGQIGTYQFQSDTVIEFVPAPSYGPPFVASFDPGAYTEGVWGRYPQFRFSFGGHDYWLINDQPLSNIAARL